MRYKVILGSAGVAVLDLLSKIVASRLWVEGAIEPGTNPGLALGVIDLSNGYEMALMSLGVVVVAWWAFRRSLVGRLRPAATVLICGGAAGNLIDRLLYGSVHDFLVTPWLVFNLADAALIVGVVLLYRDLLHVHVPGRIESERRGVGSGGDEQTAKIEPVSGGRARTSAGTVQEPADSVESRARIDLGRG